MKKAITDEDSEQPFDWDAYAEKQAERHNNSRGELTGYDCSACKNKGFIAIPRNGDLAIKECKCMEQRRNIERIESSGLKHLIERCTFDNYAADKDWQRTIKGQVQQFCEDYRDKWLLLGGQVGSGKTHLCTAVVNEFLKMGFAAKYMLWRDETVRIKASVNDDAMYSRMVSPLKTIKVLYIDDFFKTEQGKNPTTADVNLAFEVLNYRYNNPELITIISTELDINKLTAIDEAVGSRIYHKTRGYCLFVNYSRDRNYRFKGAV